MHDTSFAEQDRATLITCRHRSKQARYLFNHDNGPPHLSRCDCLADCGWLCNPDNWPYGECRRGEIASLGLVSLRIAYFLRPRDQRPARTSNVIMFVIDEKAVSDAVTIDQSPRGVETSRSPPPAPPAPPSLSTDVAPPPTSTVTPPSWSGTPAASSDGLDLPLPAIAGGILAAFAVGTFAMRGRSQETADSDSSPAVNLTPAAVDPAPAVEPPASSPAVSSSDVSIPYDAAARIAYDNWRATNNKGAFDEAKFQKFRTNYEAICSANMTAKKKARDTGTSPEMKSLPASADE